MKNSLLLGCVFLFSIVSQNIFSQTNKIVAFPGAEGAGALASGGRGGEVFIVTNLNAEGPGSLRDAVSKPNRFIVFAVSGIIDLLEENKSFGKTSKKEKSDDEVKKEFERKFGKSRKGENWAKGKLQRLLDKENNSAEMKESSRFFGGKISIDHPNITIAGQTAPGEGITIIHGSLIINASNVIIQNIRVRRGFIGEGQSGDGISVKGDEKVLEDIIIDHCSASWTTDENITMTAKVNNGTVQYSIASEGCDYYNKGQTPPRHSEGSLFGTSEPNGVISFHHIIYANNRLRNPRVTGGSFDNPGLMDLRNCVVSNWVEFSTHTGSGAAKVNFINNYYKAGFNTWESKRNEIFGFRNKKAPIYIYVSGNYLFGNQDVTLNNWLGINDAEGKLLFFESGKFDNGNNIVYKMDQPFASPYVTTHSAEEGYSICLEESGAIYPSRDEVDYRIVKEIIHGAGRIIDTENDFPENKRWPDVWSLDPFNDSDSDGIPDYWELQYNLNEHKNDSMSDADNDGYTNIEEYVHNTLPVSNINKNIVWISTSVPRSIKYEGFPGEFKISRNGILDEELNVNYEILGTAVMGIDFKKIKASVIIPAGEKFVKVKIDPLLDGKNMMGSRPSEEDKSIVIKLSESSNYSVGCPGKSMLIIKEH